MKPTPDDQARIAAAVKNAEQKTSGEIVIVLARDVSEYREVPLAWGIGAALIAPPLAVWAGAKPLLLLPTGWSAGHAAALDSNVAWAISIYAFFQAALFVAVYALTAWKPVRKALTPVGLKRQRSHKAALAQFLATGMDGTPDRTGVVIFAALDDHIVEVVADAAIHEKVGAKAWDDAVRAMQDGLKRGALAEGLERGVELCGAALAAHFPPGDDNRNALPDAPRVI